ncbi:histidinol-phosphatase HisJ family protein [Brotaphodocola sp.]|uniref:histidinol-phosphatase HisJ family protein n=1 Tax=Brotaphodocola sp. TaxID=3073577 RepID=UPI003D7C3AEA
MMRADYHVHTEYSDDSAYEMEQVVRDAIERGIDELCFTDHVDYGIKRDWDEPGELIYRVGGSGEPDAMVLNNVDYPKYVAQIRELQKKYGDKISIKLGLEFGMQAHTIDRYEKLFARYPFDFIILFVHEVEDKEFWNQDFQKGRSQQEYNERYYEELLYLVKHYHNYSILGHVDLITRYDNAGVYPFEKVKPVITEILKTVIADGKGIEVNTSSHRYGLKDLTPSRDILRLYHELGGRIITIGSDSHKPEHLGAYIDDTKQELRALGFTEFCTFDQMKPVYHPL